MRKAIEKLNDSLQYGILGDIVIPALVSVISAVITALMVRAVLGAW